MVQSLIQTQMVLGIHGLLKTGKLITTHRCIYIQIICTDIRDFNRFIRFKDLFIQKSEDL